MRGRRLDYWLTDPETDSRIVTCDAPFAMAARMQCGSRWDHLPLRIISEFRLPLTPPPLNPPIKWNLIRMQIAIDDVEMRTRTLNRVQE